MKKAARNEGDVIAMLLDPPPEGPRLRKRERTQRALVIAAIQVIARDGLAAATPGQIASAADVTSVTFYNYFKSKAEIVNAVGLFIAETIRRRSAPGRAALATSAERMAAGCLRYLHLAELSPGFAMLVVEVAEAEPAFLELIGTFVRQELRGGIRDNDFAPLRDTVATDLVVGSVMRAMRRIAQGGAPRSHRTDITLAILRGLGLPSAEARRIVGLPLDALIGKVP
ncbi:MAG TPA: TetR/AcrR family transcriptional regulator [Reyranella sp.]|jgi:AcrR family transcriptional regulator|nr:TetR/AcrR family transcriptional regulator [Reyranella sp.]